MTTTTFDFFTHSLGLINPTCDILVATPQQSSNFSQFLELCSYRSSITNEKLLEFAYITNLETKTLELVTALKGVNQPAPEIKSFYAVSGDKVFHNYHDYALHRLDVDLTQRQKRRPDLSKDQIFKLMNGLDSDSIEYALEEMEYLATPDTSNIFRHKGKDIDVTKLSEKELFHYLNTVDETYDLLRLEHVRTVFHVATPNEMLHYPEPFTASPSFIHDDLHFLHIIHYQFWLWFFFIFLICFFFLSFLCTVRWCQLRNKPRRETRGVSRSKCGDLITAIVPVTWAISIIVGESTDAADTYDGFATNEVMIGIRAYQWGWEYFYPKDLNLQYNVKPSYSTFVGNSLKYNSSSELTLQGNVFWKQYQKKELDQTVTPAHLLVIPVDNNKMFNFLNFNDIGATTSNKSTAFKKIRANAKIFTTNLIATPNPFMNRYNALHKLTNSEGKYLESVNYGLTRQHNLSTHAALNCNNLNFLDNKSFLQFLDYNTKYNSSTKNSTASRFDNPSFLRKIVNNNLSTKTVTTSKPLANNQTLMPAASSVLDDINFLQLDGEGEFSWGLVDDMFLASSLKKNTDHLSWDATKNLISLGDEVFTDSLLVSDEQLPALTKTATKKLNTNQWVSDSAVDTFTGSLETLEPGLDPLKIITRPLSYDTLVDVTNYIRSHEWQNSAADKSIIPAEQSIRYQMGNNAQLPKRSNLNYSGSWNSLQSNLNVESTTSAATNLENLVEDVDSNFTDKSMYSKVLTNRFYLPAPLEPIVSNNPYSSLLEYDNPNFAETTTSVPSSRLSKDTPFSKLQEPVFKARVESPSEVINILQGKKEGSMEALATAYWRQFWANSTVDLRIEGVLKNNKFSDLFPLPQFTTYYDYDFRNDQAFELLEEVFWETSYSSYTHLDYLDINDNLFSNALSEGERNSCSGFFRSDALLNQQLQNSDQKTVPKLINSPILDDISSLGRYYSNHIQSDDSFLQPSLLKTKDFLFFTFGEGDVVFEESYSDFKNYEPLFNYNTIFSKTISFDLNQSFSTNHVLNSFRSNYEDWNWSFNNLPTNSETQLLQHQDVFSPNQGRFTTHPSLRLPAKNSITTFNALQKVFRTRFDEGRMNAKVSHFGEMEGKQPFVSAGRLSYETMLSKNTNSFFYTNYFSKTLMPNLNPFSVLTDSFKLPFFDFPFLLSEKSESPMYLWFDWFVKWRWIDVQPVITGKYTTLGVPAVRKYFDYNVDQNSAINDADLYTTRISRARHNYLPNWVYTPYLFSKLNLWDKVYLDSEAFFSSKKYSNLKDTRLLCEKSYWVWQDLFFDLNFSDRFLPSISGDRINQKSTWRPFQGIQSYYYNSALLVDILTRREYLYRNFFEKNRRVISLPKTFTAHPQHPLIKELKASFQFTDPITYGSSYSRETYYHSLSYFKFILLKNWLVHFANQSVNQAPINVQFVNDYLFYYFFSPSAKKQNGHTQELYKSQFRPLKKGITTMLRLHGTGAVAMPIEMRLRILASSRDIIHSWSVPSAGIKIDCIPGYTSHRIMTFMTPGIYWGQCQEICGRYHHWMPIICYFMKRDLFFLWCTHFIFKEAPRDFDNNSARQFNDYVRFASYDKASWLSEFAMQN